MLNSRRIKALVRGSKRKQDYVTIAQSGLFDADFYKRTYGDIPAGTDPIDHYLETGFRTARETSPQTDIASYLAYYPDLRGCNPLIHWIRHGSREARRPPYISDVELIRLSFLFDAQFYRSQFPDLPEQVDPLAHYLRQGFRTMCETSPITDLRGYRARNADLADANPLLHWLRHGRKEGRQPPIKKALHDPADIQRLAHDIDLLRSTALLDDRNRDIASIGVDPLLQHYGFREGQRSPVEIQGGGPVLQDLCDPGRHENPVTDWDPAFKVSILTPTFDTPPYCLEELFQSLLNQTYGNWEWVVVDNGSGSLPTLRTLRAIAARDPRVILKLLPRNLGISDGTNEAFALASGTHIALVDHDDLLPRQILTSIWRAVKAEPSTDWFYTDECKLYADGQLGEFFYKPDWSPILLENTMYILHLCVFERAFAERVGRWRSVVDGTQDYDFVLRASLLEPQVRHIPELGYIWRALQSSAANNITAKSYSIQRQQRALDDFLQMKGGGEVKPGFAIGYWRTELRSGANPPLLSYIMPTGAGTRMVRGKRVDLISNCIDSLKTSEFYSNVEFVIVHNGDLSDWQKTYLASVDNVKLVHFADPVFNISKKMNMGVRAAEGRYVCLLNDDIEAITERGGEDLVGLLEHRPGVGVVGPLCLYENGTTQHNGVVLFEGGPSHGGIGLPPSTNGGTGDFLRQRREVFAVTGAIAIVRRDVYLAVGGFSEDLPLNYNDVDFCLKVRRSGKSCVVDPSVSVFHFESATKVGTFKCEKEAFFARWPGLTDPYFNPNLNQRDPGYRAPVTQDRPNITHDPVRFERWLDTWIADRSSRYPASGEHLLSVCVPIYNQPKQFLEEMYYSYILQTYPNKELVIVDDASTNPETIRWIEGIEALGVARIVRHKVNQGIAGANRTWLREARGTFVVPLDADDYLTIDALQIMAHWIEKHPKCDVFYSDEFKSNPTSLKFHPFFKPDFDPFLSTNCCYHTHLMALRRQVLVAVDAYGDDRATWCHDWDALTRLWVAGHTPIHVPELLYAWRINPGSTASADTSNKPEADSSQRFVLDRLVAARGLAGRVELRPNQAKPGNGMWSLHSNEIVRDLYIMSFESFWSDPARAANGAEASKSEWILVLGDDVSVSDVSRELSVLALWDDQLVAASGLLVEAATGRVQWSGGMFVPDGPLLDPFAGRSINDSYHGEIFCQRCVDVAAPTNVLLRVSTLKAALAGTEGETQASDLMVSIGLEAARTGGRVAVTPYVQQTWRADASGPGLPVDRSGLLTRVDPVLLQSRWYDRRLSPTDSYQVEPQRWQ